MEKIGIRTIENLYPTLKMRLQLLVNWPTIIGALTGPLAWILIYLLGLLNS